MVPLHVVCIVEGQGDVSAAPVLLKRLVKLVNPDVYVDVQPFRVSRNKLVLPGELERAVERAGRGLRLPGAVLIVIDSDDDCPKELAPVLLSRATGTANSRWPVGVVLAKSEFESWFIAAAESIVGHAGLPPNLLAANRSGIHPRRQRVVATGYASGQEILRDRRSSFAGEQV